MALQKQVTKPNGLTLGYHRIAMIKVDLNQQITILLYSYIDQSGRQYEKNYENGLIKDEPTFPYVDAEYIPIEYDPDIDMLTGDINANAYEWLKHNRPEFEGAIDV